jgi:hypothetical protein
MLLLMRPSFASTTAPNNTIVYDGDYVDKRFYSQYLKKKKKEQELLETIQIFPAKIQKAPPILDDDEAELMMVFAELFDD